MTKIAATKTVRKNSKTNRMITKIMTAITNQEHLTVIRPTKILTITLIILLLKAEKVTKKKRMKMKPSKTEYLSA